MKRLRLVGRKMQLKGESDEKEEVRKVRKERIRKKELVAEAAWWKKDSAVWSKPRGN